MSTDFFGGGFFFCPAPVHFQRRMDFSRDGDLFIYGFSDCVDFSVRIFHTNYKICINAFIYIYMLFTYLLLL